MSQITRSYPRAAADCTASNTTAAGSAPRCASQWAPPPAPPRWKAAPPPPPGRCPRGQQHPFALLFIQLRQLCNAGGLAHAVHADHQDHRRPARKVQPSGSSSAQMISFSAAIASSAVLMCRRRTDSAGPPPGARVVGAGVGQDQLFLQIIVKRIVDLRRSSYPGFRQKPLRVLASPSSISLCG